MRHLSSEAAVPCLRRSGLASMWCERGERSAPILSAAGYRPSPRVLPSVLTGGGGADRVVMDARSVQWTLGGATTMRCGARRIPAAHFALWL